MPATGNEKPRVETSRLRPATAVGHAGAPRGRPGRVERPPASAAAWRACERTVATTRSRSASRFGATGPRRCRCRQRRFDACVLQPRQVDKYQTVRFDRNAYSVPRRCAFRAVTVKGYVDRVEVVADGQVVARHATQLRPGRTGPRPAALPGGAGAQAGGAGPRPGLPRLAIAGRRSPTCAATWKPGTARGPAAGSTSASCNCSPGTRWSGSSRRSCSCRGRGAPDAAAIAGRAERLAQAEPDRRTWDRHW